MNPYFQDARPPVVPGALYRGSHEWDPAATERMNGVPTGNPISPAPTYPEQGQALPAYQWPEMRDAWGRTGEVPPPPGGYRPGRIDEELAVQHGWDLAKLSGDAEQHRANPVLIMAFVVGLLAALILVAGMVRYTNVLPVWLPVLGQDSGYAACRAIASGGKPIESTGSQPMTQDQYRQARSVFADSRYEAVRINGVKLIDLAYQISLIPEGEEMGALAYIGGLTDAYAGLSGGCADLGFTLPPLSSK